MKLIRGLHRLLADNRGAAAIVAALSMPVVVGGMGFGTEVGYWYLSQRKLQNAADIAAYAGAVELRSGKPPASIAAAVLRAAERTGYVAARGAIATNAPPSAGAYAGDADSVEVTVQETLPRLFTGLFAEGAVPVSARAVAQVSGGSQTCVLALDPTARGAVTFTGSASAILVGCSVHANSLAEDAVVVTGSGKVETPCVAAAGGVSAGRGLTLTACLAPYEHAHVVPDPFAGLPVPGTSEPCKAENRFGGAAGSSYTISAGRYCGGMTVQRSVTMQPGVYVIDGGEFDVSSTAELTGSGVTLYLVNGAVMKMNGTAEVGLSAPTSGAYAGVLVFVDRNEPYKEHVINGSSESVLHGAIYAKSGGIRMLGGGSAEGGCTQMVARSVEFSGNSEVGVDCTGAGVRIIRSSRLVWIVE